MTFTVSITSQGQISIPAKLREKLGLGKNRKALITEEEGKLVVRPVKDLLDLRGSVKTTKKALSNDELHDFVAQELTKEAVK